MEQLSIFDPQPRARRKDPATSHAAAKKAIGVAVSHRNRIMAALEKPGNIYELAARSGISHVAVARRMIELQRMGLADPTDEKREGCRVWART